MDTVIFILIVLAIFILLATWIFPRRRKLRPVPPLSEKYRSILVELVHFYKQLQPGKKKEFEERMQSFLMQVRITGVNTKVDDIDRVLIAASAIIPIFGFPEWEYINIHEVLLYPSSFNHDFDNTGSNRPLLGMVGDGPYQNVMILSQQELRQDFLNETSKSNTAIHEFIHLLDKTDGSTDGIPESILTKKYVLPWLELMRQKIAQLKSGQTDIDPYGATNQAEFFAVVSEYFFERPNLLQNKHPDLYNLLSAIFRQQPPSTDKT